MTAGFTETSKVVINSDASPKEIRQRLKLHGGWVYCVDALKIAMESKSRINMVMLGAIVKAAGFIPLEPVEMLVKDTLGKKYPIFLKKTWKVSGGGYEEVLL